MNAITQTVPFLDLKAQLRAIRPEIRAAIEEVFDSGQFILGSSVETFEDTFARYSGVRHAIAVNSGTSALHLALLAADVGPGDEVITTPMTFVATVAAILYAGATPVFVDIDPETWTLDPRQIAAAITPRTKCIMPVHLHGLIADMDAILSVARAHNLIVIEDAAQAHGAVNKGRRAGSLGHIGCFSFYPGKNLGAFGEGGAAVTDDPKLAETMAMLRDWGQSAKYHHVRKGFNYRMDGVQGAVLSVKMKYIEQWTEARRGWARRYDDGLAHARLQRPAHPSQARHVYHVYAVLVEQRDSVRDALQAAGIATGMHYPIPVHLQPAYADLGYRRGEFPVAERVAGSTLSLPMFPELTEEQVDRVCCALREALA